MDFDIVTPSVSTTHTEGGDVTQPSMANDKSDAAPIGTATTDWTEYQVPTLAEFLKDNLGPAQEQVGAWNIAHDSIGQAARRLLEARAALAEAWPPERSHAAAAYFHVVDELIFSMQATADAAIANRNALNNTLNALESARAKVDVLYSEWRAYAAHADTSGLSEQQDVTAGGDAWAWDLNTEAQQHMVTTDEIIFDNTRALIIPAVFQMPSKIGEVTPIPSPRTPSSQSLTPSTEIHIDGQSMGEGLGSPLLAGIGGSPLSAPNTPGFGQPSKPSTREATTAMPPGSPMGAMFRANESSTPGRSRSVRGGSIGQDPQSHTGTSVNLTRPEAVTSAAQSSQGRAGEVDMDRGAPASGTASVTEMPAQASAMLSPGMAGRSHDEIHRRGRRTKQRVPWNVSAGVPSVICASSESDMHDPGPGVIGIDR